MALDNTLYTFGCSFTAYYNNHKNYIKYKKYKGNKFPPHWTELLSNKLNLKLNNFGYPGMGNDQIFQLIAANSNFYIPGDVIIVGWSFINRFKWANDNLNVWERIGPGFEDNGMFISESTLNEILINRSSPLYINDIRNYEKLLDLFASKYQIKIYYWSFDKDIINNKTQKNKNFILHTKLKDNNSLLDYILECGGNTITTETNSEINDYHLGEVGHKIQSELFYDYITNNQTNHIKPKII
jgi:hypothetical protein